MYCSESPNILFYPPFISDWDVESLATFDLKLSMGMSKKKRKEIKFNSKNMFSLTKRLGNQKGLNRETHSQCQWRLCL